MQLLPPLGTTDGSIALPLSGHTAEQILAALCSEEDADFAQRTLTSALERDASFALWAVCKAAESGHAELDTAQQLARWLAGTLYEALSWPAATGAPAISNDTLARWADLVAQSFGVAVFAGQLALDHRLDRDRAYFLGLLHAAPRWSAGARGNKRPALNVVPRWLTAALATIDNLEPGEITSGEQCVATALRIASAKRPAQSRLGNFRFNRRQHSALVAEHRAAWLASSQGGQALPAVMRKFERLQTLEQKFERTLEAEKIESLKELAYGAGHEINNPLANISARAQTLLQTERDPDRRRLLAAINAQAFRAHEMIADMMLFARPPQPRPDWVDLVQLLHDLADELAPQATAQHSELVLKTPERPVTIHADKTQIAVAVRAVCANALEALVTAGRVEIELHAPAPLCKSVQITISDNGPGISDAARGHLFDPFYSGREAGRGLGFGLSKCWRIVTMHGGQVEAENNPDHGAKFAITLPIAANR